MRREVFDVMGTTVSLAHRGAPTVLPIVAAVFDRCDARFSLYRPQSELSRLARGELTLPQASIDLREVYASATTWRDSTGGNFTPHRPDGVIDLNGIVKALAMQQSDGALRAVGETDWCLNVGGDVLCSGSQDDGAAWSVGIIDPFDRARLLCAITLPENRAAVATSGSAERGDHIWRSSALEKSFVQASVVAADIVTADVLATAIIAGGRPMLDWVTQNWEVDVLAVATDKTILASPGIRSALAA